MLGHALDMTHVLHEIPYLVHGIKKTPGVLYTYRQIGTHNSATSCVQILQQCTKIVAQPGEAGKLTDPEAISSKDYEVICRFIDNIQ